MSETALATNTPAEALPYEPLHPRTPAEGQPGAVNPHGAPNPAAQAPQAPKQGVASIEELLDASVAPTPTAEKRIPPRDLTERQKRKVARNITRTLSSAVVVVKDENGKIMTQLGKDNQWHIKTRLDMNAYAKQNKDDGYAARARKSGYGNEPEQGSSEVTAKQRLHNAVAAARERLQSNDQAKTKNTKEAVKDKNTGRMAAIGGLAVAKATGFFGKEKPAEPAKATTVARVPVPALQKTAGTGTKEMPAVPALTNTSKAPESTQEKRTKRQKIVAAAIGGVAAIGLLGFAGYAAYEADKNLSANSQEEEDTQEETSTDNNNTAEGGTKKAAAKQAKDQGEVANDVTSASKAERTLSLPDGGNGNIWNSSREFLEEQGVKPTDYNIDVVKDAVLAAEGLSEEDARNLPVNYTFTIPTDALTRIK